VNQLLAGLALLAVTSYLIHTGRPVWITLPPLLFMVIMTTWAMVSNGLTLLAKGHFLPALLSGAILLLQVWMLIESVPILYAKRKAWAESTSFSPEIESS
jgi:carbon starvation protein